MIVRNFTFDFCVWYNIHKNADRFWSMRTLSQPHLQQLCNLTMIGSLYMVRQQSNLHISTQNTRALSIRPSFALDTVIFPYITMLFARYRESLACFSHLLVQAMEIFEWPFLAIFNTTIVSCQDGFLGRLLSICCDAVFDTF